MFCRNIIVKSANSSSASTSSASKLKRKKSKSLAASIHAANSKACVSEPAGHGDYTFTLAQIVATQHQIQIRNLEFDKAMALVAERVIDIARASGAAIGIVDGNKIRYRAVAGSQDAEIGN